MLDDISNLNQMNFPFMKTYLLTLFVTLIVLMAITILALILMRSKSRGDKRIARAAQELKRITNSVHAGILHFYFDGNLEIIYASRGFYDMIGYTKDEVLQQYLNQLRGLFDEEDVNILLQNKRKHDISIRRDMWLQVRDGDKRCFFLEGNVVNDKSGRATVSAVLIDVTEARRMQERLMLEEERYRIAGELNNDVLFEYSIAEDTLMFSNRFSEIFGGEAKKEHFRELLPAFLEMVHTSDREICAEYCRILFYSKEEIPETVFRLQSIKGNYLWCHVIAKSISNQKGEKERIVGKISNIDSYKREIERLENVSMHDPLTGVYNKMTTQVLIQKNLDENKDKLHIMLVIDIDDFKSINDQYGHAEGDYALIRVISEVKQVFPREIIGRIGGDEFVVFIGEVASKEEVLQNARQLKNALNLCYTKDEFQISVTASIGVSVAPLHGIRYEALFECADTALYKVKNTGKNNFEIFHFS